MLQFRNLTHPFARARNPRSSVLNQQIAFANLSHRSGPSAAGTRRETCLRNLREPVWRGRTIENRTASRGSLKFSNGRAAEDEITASGHEIRRDLRRRCVLHCPGSGNHLEVSATKLLCCDRFRDEWCYKPLDRGCKTRANGEHQGCG